MPRIALPVPLSAEARNTLDKFVHAASTPQLLALHSRIVLAAADGSNNQQIDAAPRVPPVTVGKWRQAFAIRIEGLRDAPRSGRPHEHHADIRPPSTNARLPATVAGRAWRSKRSSPAVGGKI